MLGGLALGVVFNVVLSRVDSVASLIAVRMCLGLACSTGPAEMAYITDSVTDDTERTKVIALQMGCITAGGALGPAIAGILVVYGFPVLCYTMAGIGLINFVLGAICWKEPPKRLVADEGHPRKEGGHSNLSSVSAVVKKLLCLSLINSFCWQISDGPETAFLTDHFNFNERALAIFFTTLALSMCAMT